MRGTFSIVVPDKSLNGSLLTYYRDITRRKCLINCMKHVKCQSTNFIAQGGNDLGWCELNSRNISANVSLLVERKGCVYSETPTNQKLVRYRPLYYPIGLSFVGWKWRIFEKWRKFHPKNNFARQIFAQQYNHTLSKWLKSLVGSLVLHFKTLDFIGRNFSSGESDEFFV